MFDMKTRLSAEGTSYFLHRVVSIRLPPIYLPVFVSVPSCPICNNARVDVFTSSARRVRDCRKREREEFRQFPIDIPFYE